MTAAQPRLCSGAERLYQAPSQLQLIFWTERLTKEEEEGRCETGREAAAAGSDGTDGVKMLTV